MTEWTVTIADNGIACLHDERGLHFANVRFVRDDINAGECLAKIVAAPAMLEALVGVVRVADRATQEFDAARAAIAQAKGQ